MHVPEPDNLFPLPVTAFEKNMLVDQTPGFPMAFLLQFHVDGVVNRDIVPKALSDALHRHPLMTCLVRRHGLRTYWHWSGQIPEVDWDTEHWGQEQPWNQAIDLRHEIGLRIWGTQNEHDAVVTFQFHHACCDGIGASQFIEDYAIAYSRHSAEADADEDQLPQARPINHQLLLNRKSQRGRRVANLPGSLLSRMSIILQCTIMGLRDRKIILKPRPDADCSQTNDELGLMTAKLARDESKALRHASKAQNASINDVLIRDLMLTVDKWNQRVSTRRPKPWFGVAGVSILVPSSLRGPSDDQLPACNVVGLLFIGRPVDQFETREDLLISVRDEMEKARMWQAGWFYVQVLEIIDWIPGALRTMSRMLANSCMSSAVLSHMGNTVNTIGGRLPRVDGMIQMGNLSIREIRCVPPIRRNTNIALGTMMVNGQLQINMRYNADCFTPEDARQILDLFIEQLNTTSGINPQPASDEATQPEALPG